MVQVYTLAFPKWEVLLGSIVNAVQTEQSDENFLKNKRKEKKKRVGDNSEW